MQGLSRDSGEIAGLKRRIEELEVQLEAALGRTLLQPDVQPDVVHMC
jgi:hypothetical protein